MIKKLISILFGKHVFGTCCLAKLEDCVDDGELGTCCIGTTKCFGVRGDHTGTYHIDSTVDCSSAERHLHQCAQLIDLCHANHRMQEATTVSENAVSPGQWISCNSGPIAFNLKYFNDLGLRLRIDVRMHQCVLIITTDDVAECR